ncbi:MAG: ADP-ribosylglycohydrolase family protein [Sideroxyarcus sp.]|nr:ADP-ribosylglycohydrolase family protein [Sideroxyarcus sp.]
MGQQRESRTINSSLWAAYGDILGFPMELVDSNGVMRRIGDYRIIKPVTWKRMVGGKFGALAVLGAGSYSDDTQLRLSTSRTIRGDGYFDVEALAKIELPVWLSYSLGAGRGSKLAASSLVQKGTAWFSNFYEQNDSQYINGGGNGAAMRIQPHVWAATDLSNPSTFLLDVLRNSICTHGHPHGIGGALIHAASLAFVLREGTLPSPNDWKDFGRYILLASDLVRADQNLSTFWLPTWNKKADVLFDSALEKAHHEWKTDVEACNSFMKMHPNDAYEGLVRALGGLTPEQRGSGLKSALFALAASWLFKNEGAEATILTTANLLSSDTDTVATMTGALIGAYYLDTPPHGTIQDIEYLTSEAQRLCAISRGGHAESFEYPDLLNWMPPKNQLDSLGTIDGRLAVAGLGWVTPFGEEFATGQKDALWQWHKFEFGQTVLCKRRTILKPLASMSFPAIAAAPEPYVRPKLLKTITPINQQMRTPDLFENSRKHSVDKELPSSNEETLDELTNQAIRSGFNPEVIGLQLLTLSARTNGIELAIAYAAIIAKARRARLKKEQA